MSLQVWLPLNQGPKSMVPGIEGFSKETSITVTADTDGWYKIADSSHISSNRWGIYKDFYVKSNTTYTLTVYSKSTTGITASIGIQSYNGYVSWPAQRDTNNTSTEKLTTYTWTTTATDNWARVYLAMSVGNVADNNYVFYKDIKILETPEIKNQGLADVTITNSGATYTSTEGKIGGSYYFNGSSRIQTTLPSVMTTIKNTTVAAWVKSTSSTLALGGISHDSTPDYYAPGCTLYSSGWQTGTGSSWAYVSGGTVANTSVWHHVACVIDNTDVTTYLDGVQVATKTLAAWGMTSFDLGSGHFIEIGSDFPGGNEYLTGYINDFRIYNNALSAKEVKKLSQGLILHYPLNRKGFGQDNILINTHFDSRYSQTTGWDTTKNGTLMASSWGGYNSGVTNQATVYHAHLKEFNGEYVYEYIKTSDESWLGIAQSGLQSKMTAGKTYTFSWEEYHTQGTNRVGTGLYYFKPDAASANFHLGIQQKGDVSKINVWQKCSYTFVAPTDADWSKNMSWYIYGHYNGNGTFYLRHIKLEEGSIPTPWSPNSIDTFINLFDFNSTLEYDTSGFGNHGTRHGTFTYSSDTPKYHISTYASGSTTTYLEGPVLPAEAKTVSLWIKANKSSNGAIFNDKTSGLQIGLLNSLLYMVANVSTAGFTTTHWVDGQWNHVVAVNNNGTRSLYVNGQAETQSGASNYYVHNADNCWIWNRSYNNNYPFTGSLSDLQVYATALSAEDVLALYNNKNF